MNPGEFIPLFEENGFVARMDFYIWEEACKALRSWKDKGWPVVPLSVNMSRKDFDVPDVVAKLVSLVDTYGLEHDLLHIEVTESTISGDPTRLANIVRELHEAGFVIELDDFGRQRAEVCGDDGQDAEPETGGGRSGNRGTGRTAAGYGL